MFTRSPEKANISVSLGRHRGVVFSKDRESGRMSQRFLDFYPYTHQDWEGSRYNVVRAASVPFFRSVLDSQVRVFAVHEAVKGQKLVPVQFGRAVLDLDNSFAYVEADMKSRLPFTKPASSYAQVELHGADNLDLHGAVVDGVRALAYPDRFEDMICSEDDFTAAHHAAMEGAIDKVRDYQRAIADLKRVTRW